MPPLPHEQPVTPKRAQEERNKQRETVQFRARPVRHHVSESEDEESDVEEEVAAKKRRAPVMSLRPKSRIIGFN